MKWTYMKKSKGNTDAARGKLFTRIGKEITVAARLGGADPGANPRLREMIAKGRSHNMPNDNIQRCIKRATEAGGGANYEAMLYEGYGPAGVAVMVEALTDNKNRTAGEVRSAFEKVGGSLGVSGSVAFAFERDLEEDEQGNIVEVWKPTFTVEIPDDKAAAFEKMLNLLDASDDVQEVYHNALMADE